MTTAPFIATDGALIPSDRQIQDYLLCEACEDILDQGGENDLVDKLAAFDKTFPLYDAVTATTPAFDVNQTKGYLTVGKPDVQIERLIHLAMGIFRKAGVHPWKGGSKLRSSSLDRTKKVSAHGFVEKAISFSRIPSC